MERRLAAILAADVVGYSRLMGEDEAGTFERLKSLRVELVQPKISAHGGRIVKLMGDGLLAEFPSVVEAVQAAVAIQEALSAHEADISRDQQIMLRIGVNLGDIMSEGSDIYGDGVNVAARLEGLADAGGICISGPVFDMIDGKLELGFESLGEREVKNITKAVRVYKLTFEGDGEGEIPLLGMKTSLPDKPSVAVLPFTNMSGNAEEDYFADGLSEDIITELSRFQSIFVIARNSAFTYKGKAVRVEDVGRELGVHYVVEGSVRKAGNRVRVTVQLIDARSGNHIWADRYDQDLECLFELQDDLTRGIASTLLGRVEAADLERIKRKPARDVGAYDCVLRAKLYHHRGTREDNAEALRLLDRALDYDPEFASAYAWKGCTLAQGYMRGYLPYSDELEEEIYQHILKGLSFDSNDLECVRTLCEFRIEQKRLDEAVVLNDKALRINGNDPRIVAQRGEILTWLGQPEDGAEWIRKAMRLDPYDAEAWCHLLGRALFGAKRYQETVSVLSQIPLKRYSHHAFMAASYANLEDGESAKSESAEVLKLKPNFSASEFCGKELFYKQASDCAHVREALLKAGLPE